MANYYWVGGASSGNNPSKYDWNTPSNWRTVFWQSSATGGSFGWNYQTASYSPGPGDTVYVGTSNVGSPPKCNSPLLFGGYSGNAAYGDWSGATSSTGATFGSSLVNLHFSAVTPWGFGCSPAYPFTRFGGGLTGDNYLWAIQYDGLTDSGLTGATAQRASSNKIKVANAINISTKSSVITTIDAVRSLSIAPGTTSNVVNTILNTSSIAGACLAETAVGGIVKVNGGHFATINNTNTNLTIEGVTCGSLKTSPSYVFVDGKSRFSDVSVNGSYRGPVWFGGSLDTRAVLSDLGYPGSVTGSYSTPNDSTMTINPVVSWWNPTGVGITGSPTVFFGTPGSTSQISYFRMINVTSRVADAPSSTAGSGDGAKWDFVFSGGASGGMINLLNSDIKASGWIDAATTVRIGTLNLAGESTLDFASAADFNNWYFGTLTGGTNPSIEGGVVFQDEYPLVRGSAGVRLFNTQVVFSGRLDRRTNTPILAGPLGEE